VQLPGPSKHARPSAPAASGDHNQASGSGTLGCSGGQRVKRRHQICRPRTRRRRHADTMPHPAASKPTRLSSRKTRNRLRAAERRRLRMIDSANVCDHFVIRE
jgi:hypothetical protein